MSSNRKGKQLILYFLMIILGFACTDSSKNVDLPLSEKYQEIEKINYKADCLGPDGGYITSVNEDKNQFLFEQTFTYKLEDFRVNVIGDTSAYLLDSAGLVLDTLSKEVAWVIRSHHFHKMAALPFEYFDQIEEIEGVDQTLGIWYSGKDPNGNQVRFRIYPSKGRLERLEVVDPTDPDAVIAITYKSFIETVFGPIAKRVDIQQNVDVNYIFQFKQIQINGQEML